MAKTLMKALHTEMTADLPAVAALLQKKGRGKDTILAHITPKEAALLKQRGGRGSKNPDTGLLEFDDDQAFLSAAPEAIPSEATAAALPAQTTPIDVAPAPTPTSGFQPEIAPAEPAPPSTNVPQAMAMPPTTVPQAFQTPAGQTIAAQDLAGLQRDYTGAVQPPPPAKEKSFLDSLGLGGISGGQALGGAVLGGLGAIQARNAAQQGQQAKQELLAQAQPYREQGARQVAAAQSGQLSPASQKAYEAARARAAQQGMAAGGGVGVVQSEAALESFRQELLAGDLNIGLQIQAIGDKIAQGAIQAGVQADQYVNTLTGNYAMNIGRVLMGTAPQTPGTQTQTAVT
jgi:hypothetical protein